MGIWIDRFRNYKFRNKLFLSYMVVVIVPIIILGAYSYTQASGYLIQQAKQGLSDSIRQMADNVNYRVKKYNSALDFIAFNKGIQQIVTNNYSDFSILYMDIIQQIDPVFTSVLKQNDDIEQVTIYTENNTPEYGKFIMSADRVRDTAWYRQLSDSSRTVWYESAGKLFGVRRIYNEITSMKNTIYIQLNVDRTFDNLKNVETGQYGLMIANADRDVIYSLNSFKEDRFIIDGKRLLQQNEGIVNINGISYLLIKSTAIDPDWTIYFYMPSGQISVNMRNIISATVVIISLCILLFLMISKLFSNMLVKRIENLNSQIDKVEAGNLGISVQSLYHDEIGDLTNKFGIMLSNIHTLITEVYQGKIIQKEAELQALQAQINPHFLYNTLSMINWKAIHIDADEISDITTKISSYYRSTLNKGRNAIPIHAEIMNTRIYVDLCLLMHDNSFDAVYDIDEGILDYMMINLTLQPIVENAIGHGIDNRTVEGRGLLKIGGHFKNDDIEFVVEDNGPGMEEAKAATVLVDESTGYGLKNVHDRLKIFFGESYGLSIHSLQGEGVHVTVLIPKCKQVSETGRRG